MHSGRAGVAGLLGAVLLVGLSSSEARGAGLVAAYAFDEGGGSTVADASGNGNTGTIHNATWMTGGKYGKALSFNGTSARVTVLDAPSLRLTTAMTLEAWVNPSTATAVWRDVIYKGNDNYFLEATSTRGGVPGAGGTFGEVYGTAPLATNTWTHLAVTYDGAALRLYVNGAQVGSVARTGPIQTSSNPLEIGGDGIYGQYFRGAIDEVRVYDVALTAAQIQADMAAPIGGGAPGDTTPPSAPANLTATAAGSSQITLAWTAATDNVGVTGYRVERCQGAGCTSFAQVATPAGTGYGDTGLAAGTSYSYRVRAADAAGNLGAYSAIASATTAGSDTTPPSAPANLTATAAGSGQITLAWAAATDNVGVTGYRVERCQGAGCTGFVEIAAPAGTGYADTGLAAGTSYSYRVRAADAAGNLSAYSGTASATTTGSDTTPPTAPGTLVATAISGSQISLSWGAAQDDVGVTGYRVERCEGAACSDFVKVATPTGTTFDDTGLTPNTTYGYVVRATDAAGNLGPYSNVASATTLATASELVAAYAFEEGSGSSVSDASGRGNVGTIQNATWTTAGKYGKGLAFNGTTARVTVPDAASLHLTTGMTLEAWVSPSDVTAAWRDVIYKGNDNYFLEATSSRGGVPGAGGTFGEVYGTTTLPPGAWTHLAVTYDGATLRLYVNGTQVSSVARTGPIATSTNPLQIGGDSLYGQFFAGVIDEVRIYNVARTPSQIQSDMSTPIGTAGLPVASISPGALGFGDQATGTRSDPRTVTLTNTGSVSLGINSIAVTGANAADFARTTTCGSTLAAGASCAIQIVFTPSVTGSRTATLTISDTAPGSPHTVSLSGTGTGFSIMPRVAVVTRTQTQQFSATATGLVWSVDGVVGGSAGSGTITASGLYAPPASIGSHTVTVTTSDGALSSSATVYVSGYVGTFTHHNDNARTGQNLGETVLTPANVTAATFGKLFAYPLDGVAHASPLYVADVAIPGSGFHNVVYVATEHDSVYAFDADGRLTTPLWQVSFIDPASGVTPVPAGDTGECCDIVPEIGITGTPVIDPQGGTLYVVAKTKEGTRYVQRLHALDIATGAEKLGGPVEIQASAPGSGAGARNGVVQFDPLRHNQRPALLLVNGVVYVAFGSHGDNQPYHGWLLGYDARTLQQTMALNVTPNGEGAGIWMGNAGPAADAAGNIYLTTADGTFDATLQNWGDSFLRLDREGAVLDYFTPYNEATLNAGNIDLASAGVLLLPDQPGPHPHLLVQAGKNATIYLVDRDDMGRHSPSGDAAVQALYDIFPFGTPEPGNYSAPVYYNGAVFFSPVADAVKAFRLTSGLLSTFQTSQSSAVYPYPGGTLAISANGAVGGILWALQRNGTAAGVLRAYDPADLAVELYNSEEAGARDTLGDPAAKFSVPLVANGKVFVATVSRLTVYGLLP